MPTKTIRTVLKYPAGFRGISDFVRTVCVHTDRRFSSSTPTPRDGANYYPARFSFFALPIACYNMSKSSCNAREDLFSGSSAIRRRLLIAYSLAVTLHATSWASTKTLFWPSDTFDGSDINSSAAQSSLR